MFLLLLKSYLLGSIPFAYLFARFWKKIDIRFSGSGNVGATNVFKQVGLVPGLLTAVGDGAKGFFAVILGSEMGNAGQFLALLLAMVGHNWPVWIGFHGGGGLATLIGGMLLISKWWVILVVLAVWGILYLIIREHNRSALAACYIMPVILGFLHSSWLHFLFGIGASLVVGVKRFLCIKAAKPEAFSGVVST